MVSNLLIVVKWVRARKIPAFTTATPCNSTASLIMSINTVMKNLVNDIQVRYVDVSSDSAAR